MEDLYSRQVYAIGEDVQQELSSMKVILVGLGGVGVEMAKNIILMGVGHVTLFDNRSVDEQDLQFNPYLDVSLVKSSSVAESCKSQLQALNPRVVVDVEYDEQHVIHCSSHWHIAFVSPQCWSSWSQWEQLDSCWRHCVVVMACASRSGGYVWCGWGEQHHVRDYDGEEREQWEAQYTGNGMWWRQVEGEEQQQQERWREGEEGQVEKVTQGGGGGGNNNNVTTSKVERWLIKETRAGGREARMEVVVGNAQQRWSEDVRIKWKPMARGGMISCAPLSRWREEEGVRTKQNTIHNAPYDACAGAIIGAVAAHEAVKKGGKFTPLQEWWWWEHPVQQRHEQAGDDEEVPLDCRVLIVGAGAIGCELLKTMALSGWKAHIDLCDSDYIETSNLSRQLLFRKEHIGQSKAAVASKEAHRLSRGRLLVQSHECFVEPKTESLLDDAWRNADMVLLAVDNLEARLYVDRRCRQLGIPLVDSGTLAAKGNVQVVVPHVTESYGASSDPPVPQIPQCTLHMFPTRPQHTVQLARDVFSGIFNPSADSEDADAKADRNIDPSAWAEALFVRRFRTQIEELLSRHPPDSLVENTGAPFWSPPRRIPSPIVYDSTNPVHRRFVELSIALRKQSLVAPIAFDKDGPPEHCEWVTLFANLRADCYNIDHVSVSEARRIAGRIVPAMVTTTALVAGEVLLQARRIIFRRKRDLPIRTTDLRNTFSNLALAFVAHAEPLDCAKVTLRKGWTKTEWDFLDMKGPITWREMIEQLDEKHKMQLQALSYGDTPLWALFGEQNDEFLDADVGAYLRERFPALANVHCVMLSATADIDPEGDEEDVNPDAEIPDIRFYFA